MNVGLDTIFYVGQLIWAGFLTLRWIDGQITHFSAQCLQFTGIGVVFTTCLINLRSGMVMVNVVW